MAQLKLKSVLALCIATSAFAGNTFAASLGDGDTDPDVQNQLESMRQQLDAIRQENQAMKTEIDDLRAKTDSDWLTEARADEIRGLVADVLADADSRANLLQDGMMAGWSDHFFLADPYGRFKLELQGEMQIRFVYNYMDRVPFFGDQDQHRNGFENSLTRLVFRGFVFSPDIEYLIRADFLRTNGFANLLDAWVRLHISDDWSVKIGQFKLPFNREELVSETEQLAVERSLVNEVSNLGRSQGVEFTHAHEASRFSIAYSDGANRANTTALTFDTEYSFVARYEHMISGAWQQFSDFTSPPGDEFGMLFGIAGFAEETESTGQFSTTQTTTRRLAGTIDLSIEWGGANLFASVTQGYNDSPPQFLQDPGIIHFTGIVVQGGIYVAPKWEIFARGEYGQFAGDGGSTFDTSDLNLVTFGFNYYLEGHDLKWTTDFGITTEQILGTTPGWASDIAGYRAMQPDSDVQTVFRTQFQLLF